MSSFAVRYPSPSNIALAGIARASSGSGRTAYALSLVLAAVVFGGTVFFREMTRSIGSHAFGLRAATLWDGAFVIVAVAWVVSMALGVMCLARPGRQRTYGACSVGINLAVAMLVASTMT
jgi:hypothetical protein